MAENIKKTKKKKLSVKFLAVLLLMGILIYVGAILVGYNRYDYSIKEYYDVMAYDAAEAVAGFYTPEDMERYAKAAYDFNHGKSSEAELKAIMEEPGYKNMLSLLYHMRDSLEANDIFICTLDMDIAKAYTEQSQADGSWHPLFYIADSYEIPEDNFKLGDNGIILPQFLKDVIASYESGKRYEGHYISDGGFGLNMTAMYPIVKDGKTIACIGVEIPMLTLESNIRNFVLWVSLITAGIVLICLFLGIFMLYRSVIKPIELISKEADDFVGNNTQISEKLKSVHTGDEIETLSDSIYQMEVGINEYIDNLQKVTAEKERIGAELNVATQIQADMLPRIFPPFPDKTEFDIYATMDPAKEVGGDFYDFFLIDDDHLGMVMADVSGKGVPAALFMVIAKTLIKNRALMGGSPSEVLAYANEQLCEGNEAELFVTVWFAILTLSTGKGVAANAGHEHPVVRRKDGEFELIQYRHSPAVATMEGIPFKEHDFELFPGDTLFVYTDGVAEATNSENVLYGYDRMLAALNRNTNSSLKELLVGLREDIDGFVGEAPQFDDITMLGLHYKGKE
ncbi:MAG: PP2C family protein-serine/threonine phosphatase [Lachnospiraceae bacterium]|nr:PP2C family protein-serine/threonine phosphatase [Lachnospiraceae bacterium]